jgi:hypothetical protein
VRRPLWQEVRSVVFSCCWASPVQSFLGLRPTGLMSIFYCLNFWDSPNLVGQVLVFISPRNRIAQLYPSGIELIKHRSSSCYFATNGWSASLSWHQAHIGTYDQIFITVRHLWSSCHGMLSLTRGRVCNLLVQFVVTPQSKSRRTHDQILLFHLRLLGSLFVTSYDSQGYGGGILTHLNTGLKHHI